MKIPVPYLFTPNCAVNGHDGRSAACYAHLDANLNSRPDIALVVFDEKGNAMTVYLTGKAAHALGETLAAAGEMLGQFEAAYAALEEEIER